MLLDKYVLQIFHFMCQICTYIKHWFYNISSKKQSIYNVYRVQVKASRSGKTLNRKSVELFQRKLRSPIYSWLQLTFPLFRLRQRTHKPSSPSSPPILYIRWADGTLVRHSQNSIWNTWLISPEIREVEDRWRNKLTRKGDFWDNGFMFEFIKYIFCFL